jgi:hypothetical protein
MDHDARRGRRNWGHALLMRPASAAPGEPPVRFRRYAAVRTNAAAVFAAT